MDRRISVQRKVVGTNGSNEDVETGWEEVFKMWCDVDERSGDENYEADQKVAHTVADFKGRGRTGLSEAMRIVYNGRIYNITAILYENRNRYVKITGTSGDQYVESSSGFSSGFSVGFR